MLRFLAFSDLHYDHVFDAQARLDALMEKIQASSVQFAVSLGDLCCPIPQNRPVIERLNGLRIPVYHCVGNHVCEHCEEQEIKEFLGLRELHYSFVVGDTKCIVLNSCCMEKNGRAVLYNRGAYDKRTDSYPVLPQEELKWLEAEMRDETRKYIVFSHHSLANEFGKRGVQNREDVRAILEKRQTLLCMNGHDHGDDRVVINKIPYFTVNSASYIWHGLRPVYAYGEEIHAKYPYLKDVILYKDPLCCVVEIEGESVKVIGMESGYLSATPEEVGIDGRCWNGVSVEPRVSSWEYRRRT